MNNGINLKPQQKKNKTGIHTYIYIYIHIYIYIYIYIYACLALMGFDEGNGVIIFVIESFGNCWGKRERREEDEDAENESDCATTKQQGSKSTHGGDEASLPISTQGG